MNDLFLYEPLTSQTESNSSNKEVTVHHLQLLEAAWMDSAESANQTIKTIMKLPTDDFLILRLNKIRNPRESWEAS